MKEKIIRGADIEMNKRQSHNCKAVDVLVAHGTIFLFGHTSRNNFNNAKIQNCWLLQIPQNG